MPLRMLRDWTDSEAVNDVSWQAEVLFVRLIMKADDFGRFSANPKLLKSLLFPLKDGFRESDISSWLQEIEAAGLIATYQCESKPLLEIVKFDQRLRTKKGKWPAPVSNLRTDDGGLRTDDGLNRIEYEGNTNTKGKGINTPTQNEFIEYPVMWQEIQKAAEDIGYNMPQADAENFLAKWQAKGWKDGKTAILDWRKLLMTWKNNAGKFAEKKSGKFAEGQKHFQEPKKWRSQL